MKRNKKSGKLWAVDAPHFCAAVIVDRYGRIYKAASILKWSIGRKIIWFKRYCNRVGWKIEER